MEFTQGWIGQYDSTTQQQVRVECVRFPEASHDLVQAWNALAHDSETNRFRATSILTKIKVVTDMRARVPGGEWQLVTKRLVEIYGANKKSLVYRWISAARGLDDQVKDCLRQRQRLPQTFVFDNQWLIGSGAHGRAKLAPFYACSALRLVFEVLEAGKSVNASEFQVEFCAPMKAVEQWVGKIQRQYGNMVTHLPAYQRVVNMLVSDIGRRKVLVVVSDNTPLAGNRKTRDFGIQECRALVDELDRSLVQAKAAAAGAPLEERTLTPSASSWVEVAAEVEIMCDPDTMELVPLEPEPVVRKDRLIKEKAGDMLEQLMSTIQWFQDVTLLVVVDRGISETTWPPPRVVTIPTI